MNKVIMILVFIVSGYFLGSYLFREKQSIAISNIISDPDEYINQEVQAIGKARDHSTRDWAVLEGKGAKIYVKHNMGEYYFRYGDKYVVAGDVKIGEVFGVEGNTVGITV